MDLPTIPRLSGAAARSYKANVLAQIKDTLKPLAAAFDDEGVSEIMINAPNTVFIAKGGRMQQIQVQLPAGAISAAITLLAALVAQEVGEKSNRRILSARLPGFRVEAILPPAAVNGPSMCIRRHSSRVFTMQEYVAGGVISERYAEIVQQAVLDRLNILVVGGTGSGKTTLMNTVLASIPAQERLFIIETVHELQVQSPNHVLIECDEDGGVTPRKAVRTAMRYLPHRIIVGELRGPEAYDWLDGANTGHPGSAATIHANSAPRALPRLENLLVMADMGFPHHAIRAAIGDAVDLLVYIAHRDGKRLVSQISRLHGFERSRDQYEIEDL